jgi:hypothetical protein
MRQKTLTPTFFRLTRACIRGRSDVPCRRGASWLLEPVAAVGDDAVVLFMVIEHFKGGDPAPVYERFRERGRLAPEGLGYLGSWVSSDLQRCYQVMECADRSLLDEWMAQWADLVRFEVVEVMTSAAAAAVVAREPESPSR